MSTPVSSHNLLISPWRWRPWLDRAPLLLVVPALFWLGWPALLLLIPLWWVRLPPAPALLWLNEAGQLRLDGTAVTLQRAMKSPHLVMFRAGGYWYWLYRAELGEADWRRLKRCLGAAP
ncbi:hypothetical protein [Gallaecimonas xiamenensis]|uniref:Uncharacterized protein n=1 Tax=Gallaecimonas xiamenensis 3-C-1 TaxID=745411 RepID=K2IZD7_9GAMM|nr:hypothetical protein [Gallaecimonas xiamenensis]EKE67922.1 hypothetical protein B3C1_17812 [Gallaecimonas xiamenensis 3-C-1]